MTQRLFALFALILLLPCAARAGTQALTPDFLQAMQLGERHALVIGVSSYSGGWQHLDGVGEEVAAIKSALNQQGFAVETLSDTAKGAPPLTKRAILTKLTSFLATRSAVPGRPLELLVYYAGHGATCFAADSDEVRHHIAGALACPPGTLKADEHSRAFLVPGDAPLLQSDSAGFAAFAAKAINVDLIVSKLPAAGPNVHLFFAFDSCFSGAIVSAATMRQAAFSVHQSEPVWQMASQPSSQVLTAGSFAQEVPDQSLFSQSFVEGLAGAADANGDGTITASELMGYVRGEVKRLSLGMRYPTTPEFSRVSGKGEFLFLSALGPTGTKSEAARQDEEEEAKAELTYNPGTVRKDCPNCPAMVWLKGGKFRRGSPLSEPGRAPGEIDSSSQAALSECDRFAMAEYEVTYDEWDECFNEGACRWIDDHGQGRGRRPISGINLSDAQNYTAWLSAHTDRVYAVPDELAWEYAARAGARTARPWGDDLGVGLADCDGCGSRFDGNEAAPVGQFPKNGFGLYDVIGNVWEWACRVAPGQAFAGACRGVLRGGSYMTAAKGNRLAVSAPFDQAYRAPNAGLRVMRVLGLTREDAPPAPVCHPLR
ncbi:MAG: SUMF1/EgtB/PvdO family nonheme iron enzyme [Pseudomonadota bacterium]|nr:SUMF1/EgtB/PvdO family nonheme iron enzyme [Pseudomonadota bacterium]